MRKFLLAAVIALGAMDAHAATNLAWVCGDTSKAGQSVSVACTPQRWDYADKGLVAVGSSTWSDNVWRVASTATGNALACTLDVAAGSTATCGANFAGERYLPIAQLAVSVAAPPPPPVVTPPVQTGTGTVLLTWTNPVEQYTGLDVWQAEAAAGPWRSVATLAPGVATYTVNGLAVGAHWWYVTASMGSAMSPPSNIVTKTIVADTPPPPPPPPADPCVADPLTITNLAWPAAQSGRRSIGYNTATKLLKSITFVYPGSLRFEDTRGCVVTVTR